MKSQISLAVIAMIFVLIGYGGGFVFIVMQ